MACKEIKLKSEEPKLEFVHIGMRLKFIFKHPPVSFLVQTFVAIRQTRPTERHLERLLVIWRGNAWNTCGLTRTGTEDQLRHKDHTS